MVQQPFDLPVDLADLRLLERVRHGEPGAVRQLWEQWRDPVWSICAAMTPDRRVAVELLKEVYARMATDSRGWTARVPTDCFVAALTWRVVTAHLELPEPGGISPAVPADLALTASGAGQPSGIHSFPTAIDPGEVVRRVSEFDPSVRLVYLLDLFFTCPAAGLARLTGLDEQVIRDARITACWALVAGRPA